MELKLLNKKTKISPKNLFLIDGIGALCSAFFLGIIFTQFNKLVGIPISSLYVLASIPCFFALLDAYFYFNSKRKSHINLRVIALFNFLYCIISLILVAIHRDKLTYLAWAYILLELSIICVLIFCELKVAKQLSKT
ncbi:hypothetical protein [Tenacibaculum xiamenense]|uniref:hypothetical protein n=1 Tax=Tenacibaculum xiamenense TaxID=1261553 RepID=UPI00389581F9